MILELVDYSYGRPGAAALKAAGKHGAIRYLPYPGDGGKGIHRPEIADLHAHGLDVAFVFESTAGRAREGHDAGAADGRLALAALSDLGVPARCPVYMAVDFDATPNDMPRIDAYLAGAAEALGAARIGVYGGLHVIEHCATSHAARWFWQTYAWSGGAVSAHANIYQYHNGQAINGAAVDLDRALTADWGQWPASVPTPKPPVKPPAPKPPAPREFHTVRSGETLSGIATDHHITLARLLRFPENKAYRANPNLIHPGDKVRVK